MQRAHSLQGKPKASIVSILMFSGIMNAEKLRLILEAGLLPFIQEKSPDGHKLFQDQDHIHASKRNNVEWWPSPPESPDLNPIEDLQLIWR